MEEISPGKLERLAVPELETNKAEQLRNAKCNEVVPAKASLLQKTQEDIETERVNDWKEKTKITTFCVRFKENVTEDADGKKNKTMTAVPAEPGKISQDLINATLYAAYGSANPEYAHELLTQTSNAFFYKPDDDQATRLNKINGVLLSLNPKDEIEGMLCCRLLVLHNQYMEFINRASVYEQTSAGIDLSINRATKLMRLYNETLDALNKHRRKGEQRVTVQHVNVSDGGQAIVTGQVNQGEGKMSKSEGADHAN